MLVTAHRPGFTLVEILIVVVILGVLAAMVVPQFTQASRTASQNVFINDLRVFADAAWVYKHETGHWLEDSDSGVVPTDFDAYIEEHKWQRRTPIGGQWDHERDGFGHQSALGVHFGGGDAKDDAYMTEIDERFDDAVLTSGAFRKIDAGRFYRILAE